jgi:hypothetical protein
MMTKQVRPESQLCIQGRSGIGAAIRRSRQPDYAMEVAVARKSLAFLDLSEF